jgi:hypothetical protein
VILAVSIIGIPLRCRAVRALALLFVLLILAGVATSGSMGGGAFLAGPRTGWLLLSRGWSQSALSLVGTS